MRINYKNPGIIKSIIYLVIVVFIFFASLEIIQRVRYLFRFRSPYWLFYGVGRPPADYEALQEKGLQRRRQGVEVIEVSRIQYRGYTKYNPECKTTGFEINSFGFRGEEFDINKKEGVYRIVALGGSTTFGIGARDGFTYPDFLEKSLNAKSDKKYEVINGGVIASQAREVANLFRYEITPLNPDMIVINSLFNDLYYSDNTYKYRAELFQKINQILLKKSLFYMTLREKIAKTLDQSQGDIYKAPLKNILNNFMEDDSFWSDLKITFKNMIDTARTHNIKVVIIKQPVWLQDYKQDKCCILFDKRLEPVYKKAYAMLDEIAEEENIMVIDIASHFESFPEKDKIFEDSLHLTEEGYKYMAVLIAEHIEL